MSIGSRSGSKSDLFDNRKYEIEAAKRTCLTINSQLYFLVLTIQSGKEYPTSIVACRPEDKHFHRNQIQEKFSILQV